MTNLIVIDVTGKPVPWARSGGNGKARFTPAHVRTWQNDARQVARQAMAGRAPLAGCLAMTIEVSFVPPEGWPDWKREAALAGRIRPSCKPDLDNLMKNAKDALNGIVWLDDAQVVEVNDTMKRYAATPRVTVKVRPINAAPSSIKRRSDLESNP